MANANLPTSATLGFGGTALGASETDTIVSKDFRITGGGKLHCRADIIVGKVVAATGVSAKFQHSSGYNLWSDAKTVSITASTDKSFTTGDTDLDTLTVTGHGFSINTPIVFTSTANAPAPLVNGHVYFAIVVDSNTIQVAEYKDGPAINLTSVGTGTRSVCAARAFSITFQAAVAGDQTYLPLKGAGRIAATTGAGDSLQVADVLILVED